MSIVHRPNWILSSIVSIRFSLLETHSSLELQRSALAAAEMETTTARAVKDVSKKSKTWDFTLSLHFLRIISSSNLFLAATLLLNPNPNSHLSDQSSKENMGETRDNDAYEEELLDYKEEEDKVPDSIAPKINGEAGKNMLGYEGLEEVNPEGGTKDAAEEAHKGRWKQEADECEDPYMRLVYTTPWAISVFYVFQRTWKPFNPILGETYEMISHGGVTFISEQEMMGLSYFMLDQSRKEAEYCMENAFSTYSIK